MGWVMEVRVSDEWRLVRATHTNELYVYQTEAGALAMLRTHFPHQLETREARVRELKEEDE